MSLSDTSPNSSPIMDSKENLDSSANTEINGLREQVRDALEHLYDADVLSEHPLLATLKLTQQPMRARALRQVLTDAIQSMRPLPLDPPESPDWQSYQVLLQRYVQRRNANALADQLSMSSRHLRRIQNRAIAQLTELVLQQASQATKTPALSRAIETPTIGPEIMAPPIGDDPRAHERIKAVDEEIGWLRDSILSEPVNIVQIAAEVLEMVEPMARGGSVQIENGMKPALPEVAIHPTGLRQVLLSLFNYALQYVGAGQITLAAVASADQVVINITGIPDRPVTAPAIPGPKFIVAQRILSIFGGHLDQLHTPNHHLQLTVTLKIAGGTEILVIDDNIDMLQLYERYVSGTRYHLTPCMQPKEALEVAIVRRPQLIVLDIMMPELDGWSLLGKLRHHPITSAIPVIVCTIVSERALALSLGAAGFVNKPVSRSAFLSALDWQGPIAAPESR